MNPTYRLQPGIRPGHRGQLRDGAATAQTFAQGPRRCHLDINDQTPGAATDELTASGHRALAVSCDVSDEEQVAALVEHGRHLRPARFRVQQRRHPGSTDRRRRRTGRDLRPRERDQPARRLGLHEARLGQMRRLAGAIVNCSSLGAWSNCRPGRLSSPSTASSASRARRSNTPPRDPHQRGLPGDDRDADGRRHARQGRARHGPSHRQPANRTPRPSQRDRRGRALALHPGASFVIGVALPVDGGYTAR